METTNMKAIVQYTQEEINLYDDKYEELKNSVICLPREQWFCNFKKKSGHAQYKFSGEITECLINHLGRVPTAEEIIMLVDRGYCHFGASCTIDGTKISGYVYTD